MRPIHGAPESSSAGARAAAAERPPWPATLRALRGARGATQVGWAARMGVSRKTVQRWESGARAPDPGAATEIVRYCREAGLLRALDHGPLAGQTLTEEYLFDLLAGARWRGVGRAARGGADRAGERPRRAGDPGRAGALLVPPGPPRPPDPPDPPDAAGDAGLEP
jgi:DNA-binding transcriptional regulator YiaG